MRVVARVDLYPGAMRTFSKNFSETEAIAKIQPDCAVIENISTVLVIKGET